MIYILYGLIGFVLMLLFDLFSLQKKNLAKYISGIGGIFVLFVNGLVFIQIGPTITAMKQLQIVGGIFSVVFFLLVIYSIFIEVGKNTYEFDSKPRLVTTGTYALTRHPGVLWLLLFFVSIAFMFNNMYFLLAGLVWTMTNVVYVAIQEKFIFTKLFEDYHTYCADTPMLVPNTQSVKRFITTIRWRNR